jgi:hypothetical protein
MWKTRGKDFQELMPLMQCRYEQNSYRHLACIPFTGFAPTAALPGLIRQAGEAAQPGSGLEAGFSCTFPNSKQPGTARYIKSYCTISGGIS